MTSNSVSNGTNGSSTPRPKVLIPEKVSPDGLALLKATLDVHERKGLSPDDLLSLIPEYDALIVRSETKVTASLLEAGKRLKVVARAGVGVDNVDVDAATKLGVIVVNSPVGNINAAAEHTVARTVCQGVDMLQKLTAPNSNDGRCEEHWRCVRKYKGRKVGEKSVGGH